MKNIQAGKMCWDGNAGIGLLVLALNHDDLPVGGGEGDDHPMGFY